MTLSIFYGPFLHRLEAYKICFITIVFWPELKQNLRWLMRFWTDRCHRYYTMGLLFDPPPHLVLLFQYDNWLWTLRYPTRRGVFLHHPDLYDEHVVLCDEETTRIATISQQKIGNQTDKGPRAGVSHHGFGSWHYMLLFCWQAYILRPYPSLVKPHFAASVVKSDSLLVIYCLLTIWGQVSIIWIPHGPSVGKHGNSSLSANFISLDCRHQRCTCRHVDYRRWNEARLSSMERARIWVRLCFSLTLLESRVFVVWLTMRSPGRLFSSSLQTSWLWEGLLALTTALPLKKLEYSALERVHRKRSLWGAPFRAPLSSCHNSTPVFSINYPKRSCVCRRKAKVCFLGVHFSKEPYGRTWFSCKNSLLSCQYRTFNWCRWLMF